MQGMTHGMEATLVSKEINFPQSVGRGLSSRSILIAQFSAQMGQRSHHVIVDCLQRDSQLGMDLPIGLLFEPVHRENPGRPLGQTSQELFENTDCFLCMYSVFLLGTAARIPVFDQGLCPYSAIPSARVVDEQIARDAA